MTSEIRFQEDSIQLIEIVSQQGSSDSISRIQSPLKLTKLKKNKVQSPAIQSPNLSVSSTSNISDIFIVKPRPTSPTKPVPAPRSLKPIQQSERIQKLSETVSHDVQSLFSQKSETRSYKEKLRSRFLTLKKQGEESVILQKLPKQKNKKFQEAVQAILEKEDSVINAELHKYERSKSGNGSNIEEIDANDFFCNVYNEPVEEKQIKENITSPKNTDISDDLSENSKQSLIDFLGIDNLETDLVENLPPEIIDFGLYEKDVFKSKSILPKFRNDEIKIIRSVEDDGVFKNDYSHIAKRELNILEDRLSVDDNKDWFDIDGQLKILPDPRLKHYYKPFSSDIKHDDFVDKYVPPTIYEDTHNTIDIKNNTLEIILHELKFNHHPLFSAEHVLAQNLSTYFDEYIKIRTENTYLMLIKKLDVLRCAKNRLLSTINASEDSNTKPIQNRYNKYFEEIKDLRNNIYLISKKERELKKLILLTWKLLKNTRSKQKYCNTNTKLIIKKEHLNYDGEKKKWDENIMEELAEILEELENNFQSDLSEYKDKLKAWKSLKNKLSSEEEEILPEKPKRPKRHYDEDEIKNDIIAKYNECLKPPGEPVIDFELSTDNEISTQIHNSKEKQRRNTVNKLQLFMKILCNKREICKSKLVVLNDKFICNFNEQISIQLFKVPNIINLEIYQNNMTKQLLTEFELNIPDFGESIENSETITKSFLNKEIISYNTTAVGTGLMLTDILKIEDFETDLQLFCNGTFSYNLGWSVASSSKLLKTPQIPTIFDIENLGEWVKNYPDPQDPQNALFYDYIKHLDQENVAETNYFRLEPDLKPFEFCTDEDLDNNTRFKLLQLRNNNEFEFKDFVVPNRVKEIPANIFEAYEKRKKEEMISPDVLQNKLQEDNVDTQRKWACKYLEQAENKIIQLSKIAERKILLKDVLTEEFIPSIGSIGLTFMNWLQPKRPLRPARKLKQKSSSAVSFKDMKIMVNIVGALQVPVRKDETGTRSEQINVISVRPFVVVSFQDESVRTTVAEGPNPIWNQDLIISLKTTKLTTTTLQNIKDSIVINLYDETVSDLIQDDRIRDTNIHQQLGCNWLGRIEIPFVTLLYSNRIEGTFKLNIPQVLLGYERQNIKTFHTNDETNTQTIDTFLTVFINLQPPVGNVQPQTNDELESSELQYVEEYIINWQNEYNRLFPNRNFSSFVTNLNGERCCMTRFFKPIKLPQLDLEYTEITAQQCAKYVSLISFRENSCAGFISDIWLSAEQLLTLMMGSIKDHAVLLTCFFMSLGLKTWFLLGYGMPHGFTAYVLIRENTALTQKFYIYDVKTAQKYNIHDNNCPLQRVFCVVNDENVWSNIQDEERIYLTKFDFTKTSDWLPLFGREITAPASTLHHINFNYNEPISVLYLQEKIEKKLRNAIMKWRKHSRTIWNHYGSVMLKNCLPRFEEMHMDEDSIDSAGHFNDLNSLIASYQINGFAIKLPYTSVSKIVNFVQSTGVHLNENPNIEFSLAVFVHSYLNNAIVVWLYLATLMRRR